MASLRLDVGTLLNDRYRILRVIGQGGMGTVYLGKHTETGRLVALKVLTASLARESAQGSSLTTIDRIWNRPGSIREITAFSARS